MSKILMVYPNKCTGCRNCELACAFQHEGAFRPGATRVHTFTWEREGFSVPLMCQQCDDAACVAMCPVGALEFVDDAEQTRARKQAVADKFKTIFEDVH